MNELLIFKLLNEIELSAESCVMPILRLVHKMEVRITSFLLIDKITDKEKEYWGMWFNSMQREELYHGLTCRESF